MYRLTNENALKMEALSATRTKNAIKKTGVIVEKHKIGKKDAY